MGHSHPGEDEAERVNGSVSGLRNSGTHLLLRTRQNESVGGTWIETKQHSRAGGNAAVSISHNPLDGERSYSRETNAGSVDGNVVWTTNQYHSQTVVATASRQLE